jgi:hypothetical protein
MEEMIVVPKYYVEPIAIDAPRRDYPVYVVNCCCVYLVVVFLSVVLFDCWVMLVRKNHLHPLVHSSDVLLLSDFYGFVALHIIGCDTRPKASSLGTFQWVVVVAKVVPPLMCVLCTDGVVVVPTKV